MVRTDANMIWREEFDGDALNTKKWTASKQPRTGGWWHPDNVIIKDGNLILRW